MPKKMSTKAPRLSYPKMGEGRPTKSGKKYVSVKKMTSMAGKAGNQ